jgi:hypothetical protein
MADVVKDANASMDTITAQDAPQLSGNLYAGEAIAAMDACYVAADGKAYRSNGTAANIAAHFDGFCPRAAGIGQPVSLYSLGIRARYSNALLTPGTDLYLSATTPGGLSDTATTGGTIPVARAYDASNIRCISIR